MPAVCQLQGEALYCMLSHRSFMSVMHDQCYYPHFIDKEAKTENQLESCDCKVCSLSVNLISLPLLNEYEDINYGCPKEKQMTAGWGSRNKCQIGVSLDLGREQVVGDWSMKRKHLSQVSETSSRDSEWNRQDHSVGKPYCPLCVDEIMEALKGYVSYPRSQLIRGGAEI